MEKRSIKEIQADVKKIQAASATATTIKEIAEITGLSVWKINTSLERHPIIKKRVYEAVEINRTGSCQPKAKPRTSRKAKSSGADKLVFTGVKANEVTICDAPAMISSLGECLSGPVTIPHYVFNTIVGLAKGDKDDSPKARRTLNAITTAPEWCTVADKVNEEAILVDPEDEETSWRARALVALGCKYWAEGYHVTIKTRTGAIARLARLQGVFEKICFVEADDVVD